MALYRIFAHRFNWSPADVDAQNVPLLAAFMHDFEADRARAEASREGYKPDENSRLIVDDRVPLTWRAKNPAVIDAWIRRWNEKHPDQPPIPPPEVVPL